MGASYKKIIRHASTESSRMLRASAPSCSEAKAKDGAGGAAADARF
jgi:hypothetical protein